MAGKNAVNANAQDLLGIDELEGIAQGDYYKSQEQAPKEPTLDDVTTSEVQSSTEITTSTKDKEIVTSKAAKGSKNNDEGLLLPSGTRVKPYDSVRLADASLSTVFVGNPRLFGVRENDVTGLAASVKKTGGNFAPVWGRELPDGTYEIFAGSRRRRATILAKAPLAIDLYDLNDKDAQYLSFMENEERQDLDIFAEAGFFAYKFEQSKKEKKMTVEQFAQSEGRSRGNMQRMFAINKLPDELKLMIVDPDAWSFKKAVSLCELMNDLQKQSIDFKELTHAIVDLNHTTPEDFIKAIKTTSGVFKRHKEIVEFSNDAGKIETSAKGNRVIRLTTNIPSEKAKQVDRLVQELRELLE